MNPPRTEIGRRYKAARERLTDLRQQLLVAQGDVAALRDEVSELVLHDAEAGHSATRIADDYGYTVRRIQQMCAAAGVPLSPATVDSGARTPADR